MSTGQASHNPDISVVFKNLRAACQLMVTVHVLGDDGHLGMFGQIDESLMSGVGPRGSDQTAPPIVPFPDQFRIPAEGLGGGQLGGIVLAPQAILLSTEGRNSAGCRDAGSSQGDDAQIGPEPVLDLLEFGENRGIHVVSAFRRNQPGLNHCIRSRFPVIIAPTRDFSNRSQEPLH